MKTTSQIYCQFLINSQLNYTCTYLSRFHAEVSHDSLNRYLATSKLTPAMVWERSKHDIVYSSKGYIIFDDTVIDHDRGKTIECVKRQYSGNEHKVIGGIGLIGCIYYNPELDRYWIVDFRIYDKVHDGKSKLRHVQEMLSKLSHKGVVYQTVLMDSWYATVALMLDIHDLGKTYYCPVKSNRKAVRAEDLSGVYQSVSQLIFTEHEQQQGITIKLFKYPKKYVKLFRIAVLSNRTDYIVTNDLTQQSAIDTQEVCTSRWKIEQFHRELKQTTGIDRCQCRKNRSQRNHIAACIFVWQCLKRESFNLQKTIYSIKRGMLDSYMFEITRSPKVVFA